MLPLRWEYVELQQSCFYPVVRGYAFTLAKMQGETLPHMCLWPDVSHVPGAVCTAVTRGRTADALLLLTFRFVSNFVYLQDRCKTLVSKRTQTQSQPHH